MNDKITIQNLVELLEEKHGMNKKDAELFIKGMFDLIEDALASEKFVKIKGLGTFKLTEVDSRESVNVNTGERFEIQGHTKISFTPDTIIRDLINKPFAHFETVILNENTELADTETGLEEEENEEIADEVIQDKVADIRLTDEVNEEVEKEDLEENRIVEPQEDSVKEVSSDASDNAVVDTEVEEPHLQREEEKENTSTVNEVVTAKEIEETDVATNLSMKQLEESNEPEIVVPCDQERQKKTPWALIIAIILILCIAGGVYWYMNSTPQPESQDSVIVPSTSKEEPRDTLIVKDSVSTVEKDTLTVTPVKTDVADEQSSDKQETPSTVNKAVTKATLADTVEYDITGTKTNYTLQEGETLIKVAAKFYGSKKFWPYIVRHNKGLIVDADRVPIGTTIRIPELKPKK